MFFTIILSCIFTYVIKTPFFEYKVQSYEILFLISVITLIVFHREISFNLKSIKPFFPLIFLACISIINLLLFPEKIVIVNNIGTIYLIFSALILYIIGLNTTDWSKYIKYSSQFGIWILIVLGFVGFTLSIIFDYNRFVLIYENYPYFHDVIRIKGANFSPNIYISVLCFFACLNMAFYKLSKLVIVLIISLGFLSLTKEALLLITIVSCYLIDPKYQKISRSVWLIVFSGVLYLFFSFFVIDFNTKNNVDDNWPIAVGKTSLHANTYFSIYPTTYFYLFKTGLTTSKTHFFKGIGYGNFKSNLEEYEEQLGYPDYLPTYEPHDAYFGIGAQLGFLYFIFLILLFRKLKEIFKIITLNVAYTALFFFILYMGIESFAYGTFHYRHYFVFFAIIVLIFENARKIKSQFCLH